MEGWGVGDTHFTGSHIGGIHISLGIRVRGYTYHGDTHITVTSETFGSRSIFLAHDNAGSKFYKHPISIDFIGYKNTNKLIV